MSEGLEVVGLPGSTVEVKTEPKSEPAKAPEKEPEHEQTVPYERFQKANQTAKQAKDEAKALRDELAGLREQVELNGAGASEVEQMKVRLKRAEEKAQQAEEARLASEEKVLNADKQRWITSAASTANFADPSDASAFLDLTEIESPKDAERAIKRLASSKKYLVKQEERQLPGKVLEGGKAVTQQDGRPPVGIDPMKDANAIVEGLVQFASPEAQRAWRDQHQQ